MFFILCILVFTSCASPGFSLGLVYTFFPSDDLIPAGRTGLHDAHPSTSCTQTKSIQFLRGNQTRSSGQAYQDQQAQSQHPHSNVSGRGLSGTFWCGSSHPTAGDCTESCPSGFASDCSNPSHFCWVGVVCKNPPPAPPPVQSPGDATTIVLPSNAVTTFWCGVTGDQAAMTCASACVNGLDGDCPSNLKCWDVGSSCTNKPSASGSSGEVNDIPKLWCGVSSDDSKRCSAQCPGGLDLECPGNLKCWDIGNSCFNNIGVIIDTTKWCGVTERDAGTCSMPCPSGLDEGCTFGKKCWEVGNKCAVADGSDGEEIVRPGTNPFSLTKLRPLNFSDPTQRWCGESYEAARYSCAVPCPLNNDWLCPGTFSKCYSGVPCYTNHNWAKWCGRSWQHAASTCNKGCHQGLDSECDNFEQCFTVESCVGKQYIPTPAPPTMAPSPPPTFAPVEVSAFCGETFHDAATNCSVMCEEGTDGACPDNKLCYLIEECIPPPMFVEGASDSSSALSTSTATFVIACWLVDIFH